MIKRCPQAFPQIMDCIGSECALWDTEPGRVMVADRPVSFATGRGRCGLGKGDNFPDPAKTSDEQETP